MKNKEVNDLDQEYGKIVEMLKLTLEKALKNHVFMSEACFEGLKLMLQSSDFPVLPQLLIEEGISPSQWFGKVDSMSEIMASDIVRCADLPVETIRNAEAEELLNIIGWKNLLQEVLHHWVDTLIDLGLVWYLFKLGGEMWIEAVDNEIDPVNLAKKVGELAKQLEERSTVKGKDENPPKVRWRDVFRPPL